jgi:hypothetical protein
MRKLVLAALSALESWGEADGSPEEEVTFPLLENLKIESCLKLIDIPEAPKLSELSASELSLQAASRCIP